MLVSHRIIFRTQLNIIHIPFLVILFPKIMLFDRIHTAKIQSTSQIDTIILWIIEYGILNADDTFFPEEQTNPEEI